MPQGIFTSIRSIQLGTADKTLGMITEKMRDKWQLCKPI